MPWPAVALVSKFYCDSVCDGAWVCWVTFIFSLFIRPAHLLNFKIESISSATHSCTVGELDLSFWESSRNPEGGCYWHTLCRHSSVSDLGLGWFWKFKIPTPNLTPEVEVVTLELTPGGCVIFMIIFMIHIIVCVTSFHTIYHVNHIIYHENHATSWSWLFLEMELLWHWLLKICKRVGSGWLTVPESTQP